MYVKLLALILEPAPSTTPKENMFSVFVIVILSPGARDSTTTSPPAKSNHSLNRSSLSPSFVIVNFHSCSGGGVVVESDAPAACRLAISASYASIFSCKYIAIKPKVSLIKPAFTPLRVVRAILSS